MRKIKVKKVPVNWVELEPTVYCRLQALSIESHRSETELLTMAVRLLCTAVARTTFFNLPKCTPKPTKMNKSNSNTSIKSTVLKIVNNFKEQ